MTLLGQQIMQVELTLVLDVVDRLGTAVAESRARWESLPQSRPPRKKSLPV